MGQLQWTSVGRFYYSTPEHRSHYLRTQRIRMRMACRGEPDVEGACVRFARMLLGMMADGVGIALVGDDGLLRMRAVMHSSADEDAALRATLDGKPIAESRPNGRAFATNALYWPSALSPHDPNSNIRDFVRRFGGVTSLLAVPIRDGQGRPIGSVCVACAIGSEPFTADVATIMQDLADDLGIEIANWQPPKHSGVWRVEPIDLDSQPSLNALTEVLAERRRSEPAWVRAMAESLAKEDDDAGVLASKRKWRTRLNSLEASLQVCFADDVLPDADSRRAVPIGKLLIVQRDRGVTIVWPPAPVFDQAIADAIHTTLRHHADAGEEMVVMLVVRPTTLITPAQFRRLGDGLRHVTAAVLVWDQRPSDGEQTPRPVCDDLRACRVVAGATAKELRRAAPDDVQPDLLSLIEMVPLWARA